MDVYDDYYQNIAFTVPYEEMIKIFKNLRDKRNHEIDRIKEKIKKYEQKKRAEEAWYQSLSSVRKFFAGRPPAHHQAVEYLVHVKERFAAIEQLKKQINNLDEMTAMLKEEPEKERIVLPHSLIEEIREWRDNEK
ncbi:hypothetical protein SAMN05443252_108117 [Bacillus sp. OV322]|uniref:hypothetical protein n=1 Tax=Bacillus sp. OV322 TaxID=1882764 RepID=UPI0008E8B67B|nr:hypothetical protein [Bacillus sp. OV322]SFC92032.1 hypothetical protein SAMN05443252_108117 [Bacillus sp. OV322]